MLNCELAALEAQIDTLRSERDSLAAENESLARREKEREIRDQEGEQDLQRAVEALRSSKVRVYVVLFSQICRLHLLGLSASVSRMPKKQKANMFAWMSVLHRKVFSKHVLGRQKSPKSLLKPENNLRAAKCSFLSCSQSATKKPTHSKMSWLNATLRHLLRRLNQSKPCFQNQHANKQLFCKLKFSKVGTALSEL